MSELRYNVISREWVIIATERAKRPKDFMKPKKETKDIPEYKKECPFCPGNEAQTPGETFRLGDKNSWKVRSIINKFGAVSPDTKKARTMAGLRRSLGGFGNHEVIIEHPRHNAFIALMTDKEVQDIIRAYKSRYLSIQQDKDIEDIVIFKNHGPTAGTSLEHPHSQLIATPIVPPQSRYRMEQTVAYFDISGNCMFCKTLEEELSEKSRIIVETEKFVSFIPYAALSPFHMWIFPRRHMSSFVLISEEEIADLAVNLKATLARLYYGLDNPDFNYSIRSIPVQQAEAEYIHWYISIIPRVNQPAGFELGSGMFINTGLPEESAEFLRNVKTG